MTKGKWNQVGIILAIVASVTTLFANAVTIRSAVNSWRFSLTTGVVISIIGVLLVILSTVVAFRRKVSGVADASGMLHRVPKFSRRVRRLALACLVGVPLAALVYIGRPDRGNRARILLASFGDSKDEYAVDRLLLEALSHVQDRVSTARIRFLDRPIRPVDGHALARNLGTKYGADIVIWGWIARTPTTALVNAHIEVINPTAYMCTKCVSRPFDGTISKLDNFELQFELSDQIGDLTAAILGLLELDRGAFSQAIAALSIPLDSHTNVDQVASSAMLHFYRGNAFGALGKLTEALDDYNAVIDLNPRFGPALHNRAQIESAQGDNVAALRDLSIAIESDSTHRAEYFYGRAIVHGALGDAPASMADYDAALGINPMFAAAYSCRGGLYTELGAHSLALADFAKAISLDSLAPWPYLNRANDLSIQGRFAEAKEDTRRALALAPNDPLAHYQMAREYEEDGLIEPAIHEYHEAARLAPKWVTPDFDLAIALRMKDRFAEAMQALDSVVARDSTYSGAYQNRAWLHIRLAQRGPDGQAHVQAAIRDFQRAFRFDTTMVVALVDYAVAKSMSGDFDGAITAADLAIKRFPKSINAYAGRMSIYRAKGGKYAQYSSRDSATVVRLARDPTAMRFDPRARSLRSQIAVPVPNASMMADPSRRRATTMLLP